ncbi:hypothetical protein [Chitinophaga sp. 212800010-3]|uniref:hypothetical protein n=1 Tax=unclassified Chitinophaga TaxID=2619133 RepID=UPI002DEF1652|nr:CHZ domain-containing protein [Chitinophaga sp. 212800010-3]
MSNKKTKKAKKEDQFPGYPEYPASEDIMNRNNRDGEVDLNMDEMSSSFRRNSELPVEQNKRKNTRGDEQEESWQEDRVGDDLDIPGAELDDSDEAIGHEDEENNIYSLGGDRHQDLEEDNGEFRDLEEDRN